MEKNFFVKSHGLGNEYIVLDKENIDFELTKKAIQTLCNVHFGIGSDGILLKVPSEKADFGLRIFNPDGSEAEKSGNGLRIFCKFLYDYGFTKGSKEFSVETKGGIVKAKIEKEEKGKAKIITIDMGKAVFDTDKIPVNINDKECIDYPLKVEDKEFKINCVSVGNPHCVILVDNVPEMFDEKQVKKYGPKIENNPIFPNRTNVQFVKVIDKNTAEIKIWERGAGYTLASGSSSSAVASVLYKKGLTDSDITIKMEGGELKISLDKDFNIKMTGEVQEICKGTLSEELIENIKE
ncbi:diaminopimelate epimerase [Hydrogenothermus marinus]|uniref:Diaminopimelate epimerase n=1 Tax=Hydrogenothermus marinus TaxID=133270 RepID=A0A3M0BK51_9AQUI|nr:diaminopimelate epimerase [Hydrogenothermus marinus]RMA97823.1 diaminopimelate epimerase [Hydrogenothermus marinus]